MDARGRERTRNDIGERAERRLDLGHGACVFGDEVAVHVEIGAHVLELLREELGGHGDRGAERE